MTAPDAGREPVRAEILTVARRLFMSRGYRAVSTREIAEVVGVTQPALYHHFSGKEALYVAVLEEELETIAVDLRAAACEPGSADDRMAGVATVLARRGEHDLSQMFHDLRQEISEANRQRIGMAFRGAMMFPILGVVDELVAEGVIAPDRFGVEPAEVAMLLLSNVRMLVESSRGPAGGTERSFEEIGRLATRLLTGALSSQPSP